MAQPNSRTAAVDRPAFDQHRAEAAVRELLIAIGEDPDRHGLMETPARVARACREIFGGLYENPDDVLNTTFDEQHDEMVLVRMTASQARAFANRGESVVAAGRPPCQFCGNPVDAEGHLCPRANGFPRTLR